MPTMKALVVSFDNNGLCTQHSLGIRTTLLLEGGIVVVQSLVHHSVLVGALDEALALLRKHLLCASDIGVNQSLDLETGAELVFETERVVPGSLVRAEHDVLESVRRTLAVTHARTDHDDRKVTAGRRLLAVGW